MSAFVVGICFSAGGIINANNNCAESNISSKVDTEQIKINGWKDCPDCNGTGYRTIKKKCTCLNAGCEKCNYTGTITIEYKCSTCDGKGRVRATF